MPVPAFLILLDGQVVTTPPVPVPMQDPIFITTQSRLAATIAAVVEKAVAKALHETRSRDVSISKRWLTNTEVKAYLGLGKATLARYRKTGMLPVSKVGSSVYYRLEDVEALLERGMQPRGR